MGPRPHLEGPGGVPISLYLAAALTGLALALALGVRFRDFGRLELRAAWAFLLAALGEGGLAYATARGLLSPDWAGPLAKLWVLALVGYGLWRNRHLRSLLLVLLGLGLNTLVILANGGHMPVSPQALAQVGLAHEAGFLAQKGDAVHALMGPGTRLAHLGDWIPILPFRKAISPGDVLVLLGLLGAVVEGGLRAAPRRLPRRRAALRVLLVLLALLLVLALRA